MALVDELRGNKLRFAIDVAINLVLTFWGPIQIMGVWWLLDTFNPYTVLEQNFMHQVAIAFSLNIVFGALFRFYLFDKFENNAVLLIKEYACWLTGFLVFEIILKVAINCFVCFADSNLTNTMDDIFANYGRHNMDTYSLDVFQHCNFCCGVRNYTDWELYPFGKQNPQSVADGCCKPEYYSVRCGIGLLADPDAVSKIHTTGCLHVLKDFFMEKNLTAGSSLLIIALLQLMLVLAASKLCNKIKKKSVN